MHFFKALVYSNEVASKCGVFCGIVCPVYILIFPYLQQFVLDPFAQNYKTIGTVVMTFFTSIVAYFTANEISSLKARLTALEKKTETNATAIETNATAINDIYVEVKDTQAEHKTAIDHLVANDALKSTIDNWPYSTGYQFDD